MDWSVGVGTRAGSRGALSAAAPDEQWKPDAERAAGSGKGDTSHHGMSDVTSHSSEGRPVKAAQRWPQDGMEDSHSNGEDGGSGAGGAGEQVYLQRMLWDSQKSSGSDSERSSSPQDSPSPSLSTGVDAAAGLPASGPRSRPEGIFKPTPFSVWANGAVRIGLVRGAADLGDPTREFQPLFTHQVFGPREEIVGFDAPAVEIVYAAASLMPAVRFRGEPVGDEQLAALGLEATAVGDLVRRFAPSDYASDVADVVAAAEEDDTFRPVGVEVYRYAAPASGAGGARGSEAGEFRVYATGIAEGAAGAEARTMLARLQSLAMWLIERCSYIRPDPNWQVLTLYEYPAGAPQDAPPTQLLGFVTVYRDHRTPLPAAGSSAGRAAVAMHKLRISQFVVLPPFQRRGHGEQLLRCVYDMARRSADVAEVTVEHPSPGFARLRDCTDARVARDLGCAAELQADSPPAWDSLRERLKWPRTQLRHLWSSVMRRVVPTLDPASPVSPDAAACSPGPFASPGGLVHEAHGARFVAGGFALVRGPQPEPYVAQLVGVNPVTKLVRVRWMYRASDVPPKALADAQREDAASARRRGGAGGGGRSGERRGGAECRG